MREEAPLCNTSVPLQVFLQCHQLQHRERSSLVKQSTNQITSISEVIFSHLNFYQYHINELNLLAYSFDPQYEDYVS